MFKNLDLDSLGITSITSEVIESLLTSNVKSISVNVGAFLEQAQAQGIDKARRLVDSARLKIGVLELPFSLELSADELPPALAAATAQIELAKSLGCTRAVTHLAPASDARPYHENFEFYCKRIAQVADWLKPFGMTLGVGIFAPDHCREGHAYAFIQKFDQLLLLLKMANVPQVGVHLDVWNWALGGGTVEQLAGLKAEQIIAVTLSDLPEGTTAENATRDARLFPGESGVVNVAAVLTTLKEKGYTGPVTPGVAASRLQQLGRDKIIRDANAALDKVFAAAGVSLPGARRPAFAGK